MFVSACHLEERVSMRRSCIRPLPPCSHSLPVRHDILVGAAGPWRIEGKGGGTPNTPRRIVISSPPDPHRISPAGSRVPCVATFEYGVPLSYHAL